MIQNFMKVSRQNSLTDASGGFFSDSFLSSGHCMMETLESLEMKNLCSFTVLVPNTAAKEHWKNRKVFLKFFDVKSKTFHIFVKMTRLTTIFSSFIFVQRYCERISYRNETYCSFEKQRHY